LTKSWQLEDISSGFVPMGSKREKRDTRAGGSAVDLLVSLRELIGKVIA
jgi:hypothetical protein